LLTLVALVAAACDDGISSKRVVDASVRDQGSVTDAVAGDGRIHDATPPTDRGGPPADARTLPPDGPTGPIDQGAPPVDAALPPADTAVTPADALVPPTPDALAPPTPDALVAPADARPPVVDVPPLLPDAAVVLPDAAVMVPDAAVPVLDAAVPVDDAAVVDAAVVVTDAEVVPPVDAGAGWPAECSLCHGSAETPAPPRAVNGRNDTATRGVGAHQRHLTGATLRAPLACDECHVVPQDTLDPGHLDAMPAELFFGPLAFADGAQPAFDTRTLQCNGAYCHGATLAGGRANAPVWTLVDGSQVTCDGCHGAPPPAPHPAEANCAACHAETMNPDGTLNLAGGKHLDGHLDVTLGNLRCDSCHGNNGLPAPPRALDGSVSTRTPGVGAHQAHLRAGEVRGTPVGCPECHVIPASLDAPGHRDPQPGAELTFGPLATSGGLSPTYDPGTTTCDNVYCHGSTLRGGSTTRPEWTRVDGSQDACGTCHGAPPPAPHPDSAQCSVCHPDTVLPNGALDLAGGRHIDGHLDVAVSGCDGCHGSNGDPAPPRALDGSANTAAPGVGAHRAHLQGGHLTGEVVACAECHLVPENPGSLGHLDGAAGAEVTFGPLAGAGNASPVYDPAETRCANVYCHGATLAGGTQTQPDWTVVDGSQRACGTCHGAPPPIPHPQSPRCSDCHPGTVNGDGTLNLAGGLHINGRLDIQPAACDTCHGANGNPAPPRALDGSETTDAPGVGAHRIHLEGGVIRGPLGCEQCHRVPGALDAPGHIEGVAGADLTFGGLAESGGTAADYDPLTTTCSGVYCHGATLAGGAVETPNWTLVDGTQTACDACHGAPPPAPHPAVQNCNACHPETVAADGTIDLVAGRHIDGQVQVRMAGCDLCHGGNGNPAPPRDLSGRLDTLSPGVGAHRAHLEGNHLRGPVGCGECHPVPATIDAATHLDQVPGVTIRFAGLAVNGGLAPRYDSAAHSCGQTYCHGASLEGGRVAAPVWTQVDGTQRACDACHGAPPPFPHPPRNDCRSCHPQTIRADGTLDLAAGHHMDGRLDVVALGCDGCHGTPGNPAPPVGVDGANATNVRGVGAHQAHLRPGTVRGAPVACAECHLVPATTGAAGHLDAVRGAELTFGPLARADGARAGWAPAQAMCTNVYCHGGTLAGGARNRPIWTRVDGTQKACGSCHGSPPPGPHPQSANCNACHPGTVKADGSLDLVAGLHVNGSVEFQAARCDACHGAAGQAAPPRAVNGNVDTATPGVGAHQAHLQAGRVRGTGIACTECHVVPATAVAAGHLDAVAGAELVFGALSVTDGMVPAYDRAARTCANTYCHGGSLTGGTQVRPVWTRVDGSQSACGTCHGAPPAAPHPQNESCDACHPGTIRADGSLDLAGGLHINGRLDVVSPACNACHGSAANAAPPRAVDGSVNTATPAVGAHQAHLRAGLVRGAPVACNECHRVPADALAAGHLDAQPGAELVFGALATADAQRPTYDTAAHTCDNVYCHGSSLGGGSIARPIWTRLDGSQTACGTCHGAPPPAPHPNNANCAACHPATVNGDGSLNLAGGRHIDGHVDVVAAACDACHGSNGNPAPPRALNGNVNTSDPGVGAHRAHLAAGHVRAAPIPCGECHVVPAAFDAAGHLDAAPGAEVVFGALGATGGLMPTYDRGTRTCQNTWCHGGSLTGAAIPRPDWTVVDGTQRACGACHGAPPPAPHPQTSDCATCHPGTVLGNGSIDLAGGLHINGRLDVRPAACDACHGSNGEPAPPRALNGAVDVADPGVGAHRAHLTAATLREPIPCDQCHLVPDAVDARGHIEGEPGAELTFGGLARSGGLVPEYDPVTETCNGVYCHGATLGGGVVDAPRWTLVDGTQAECDACHGAPPPAPHPNALNCNACHPDTVGVDGSIDVAGGAHIDGLVQTQMGGCDACHGSNGVAAPPRDLAGNLGTASPGVGAHRAHLEGGHLRGAIGCNECHPVPPDVAAATHLDQVPGVTMTFGALATANGAAPRFLSAQHSCSNTYCHGATLAGGVRKTPVWTRVDGSNRTCDACHGAPPPFPHTPRQDCRTCHPQTMRADGTLDLAGGHHLDGHLDVAALECDACHGGGGDPAPPAAVDGAVLSSDPGVGAHDAHLRGGAIRGPVDCEECHLVPGALGDVGHIDQSVGAEVMFGPLATAPIAEPGYDPADNTCQNVYCHGATLRGGLDPLPDWTSGPADPEDCSRCHGAPPPAPHPAFGACDACHPGTVRPDGTIDLVGGLHIDGQVEVQVPGCDGCHGSPGDPAPPRALDGSVDTTRIGVGAHQNHLGGSTLRGPLPCNSCHRVPADVMAVGHLDGTARPEVVFGGLSTADGATPAWDPATATCSGVYCHGATRPGGRHTEPDWTLVDGSQATCGACHGVPPPAPHVASARCDLCHTRTVRADGTIDLASGTHINGQVDVEMPACGGCHGTPGNPAPPVGLDGAVATADPGVGAHAAHLGTGAFSGPIACTECHVVPGTVQAAGHMDAVAGAEVTFGRLARTGSAPAYNAVTNRCSNVYCHGATLTGGSVGQPIWNRVDGTQAPCGGCHGAPPPAPHVQSAACYRCHPGTVRANGTVDVVGGLHVNGVVEVTPGHPAGWEAGNRHGPAFNAGGAGACGSCHGANLLGGEVGVSCEQCHPGWTTNCVFCHGGMDNQTGAPPLSVAGLSARAVVGVGSHTKHVAATSLHAAWDCVKCHTKPLNALSAGHIDGDGRAEVRMNGRSAAAVYNAAAVTCSATYCHGDGVTPSPAMPWTSGGPYNCAACHDDATVPSANNTLRGRHRLHVLTERYPCQECHNTVVNAANAIIAPALHVNESVQVSFLAAGFSYASGRCTGTCHGERHSGDSW
jgi:predicted CxxxxCH...CXXCH cytochrome family protein